MDKLRIFSQFNRNCIKTPLKESISKSKSGKLNEIYSFQEALDDLDHLYEADEQQATQDNQNQTTTTNQTDTANNAQTDNKENAKEVPAEIDAIKNEIKNVNIPEASVKLSGKADELYDKLISLLKKSNLKSAIDILEIASQDPKLSLLLRHGFSGGSTEDGKLDVTMTTKVLPVASLIPTQAEIGISNSLENLVNGTFPTKDKNGKAGSGQVNYAGYFTDKAPLPKPFVYEGSGGNYIVDGHHRWSQAYCMNPEGNIECEVISTSTKLTDTQILKNFQAAIAADPNRSGLGRKAAGFQNLFGASTDTLKQTVKPMTDEVAKKITAACPATKLEAAVKEVQIAEGTEDQKKAQALLVSNALKLSKLPVSDKPLRILMPQTDSNTTNIVKDAIAGI